MCDNCRQAAYELDQQWGRGIIDYPKLRALLNHREEEQDKTHV